MDIQEHTNQLQERMKVMSSGKATVELKEDYVIYSDGNNSLGLPIPQEDIITKE